MSFSTSRASLSRQEITMSSTTTRTVREAWEHMTEISKDSPVRNFTQDLDMSDYVVETDLFPVEVLDAYSAWNLERVLTDEQLQHFSAERGGGQGDYREGMSNKIENVIDCLNAFPESKRAVITISNTPDARHEDDDTAKCMREVHFYIDEGTVNASVFFRAQAASIFPKNIHFIGSLMDEVARGLDAELTVGSLHYSTTILVGDRS